MQFRKKTSNTSVLNTPAFQTEPKASRKLIRLKKFISLGLNKRQRIILSSLLITIGLIVSTQNVSFFFQSYRYIIGLSVMAYLLSLWALWGEMTRMKAVVLMILPTMFTLAVTSFYFLLPIRWLTRVPVAIVFGLSFYSMLLSQNVFNVAASRTIPLYRAASTVSFLFTLVTAFFIYNVIFAFNLPFYWNMVVVIVISFPLVVQLLWSIEMEKLNTQIMTYSIIIALMVGETALALSFWPVAPTIWSLFLATELYILLGVISEFMRERLGKRVVWEYFSVGVVVFIISLLATSWGG